MKNVVYQFKGHIQFTMKSLIIQNASFALDVKIALRTDSSSSWMAYQYALNVCTMRAEYYSPNTCNDTNLMFVKLL